LHGDRNVELQNKVVEYERELKGVRDELRAVKRVRKSILVALVVVCAGVLMPGYWYR
jgi:hypothetical protein